MVIHPGSPAHFEVRLNLSHLPVSAKSAVVYVEAYHRTTRMRFYFGTVANITPPPRYDLQLSEFPDWRDVSFRVKVSDMGQNLGQIIAWANNIRPSRPENESQTDLVRWMDADLNGLLWDMEFDEHGPIVVVEKTIGHARLGQDSAFIAVAYPEILRRTLYKALIDDKMSSDDTEHWLYEWIEGYLFRRLGMPSLPDQTEDPEPRRDWILQAVAAFGRLFESAEQWRSAISGRKVN